MKKTIMLFILALLCIGLIYLIFSNYIAADALNYANRTQKRITNGQAFLLKSTMQDEANSFNPLWHLYTMESLPAPSTYQNSIQKEFILRGAERFESSLVQTTTQGYRYRIKCLLTQDNLGKILDWLALRSVPMAIHQIQINQQKTDQFSLDLEAGLYNE